VDIPAAAVDLSAIGLDQVPCAFYETIANDPGFSSGSSCAVFQLEASICCNTGGMAPTELPMSGPTEAPTVGDDGTTMEPTVPPMGTPNMPTTTSSDACTGLGGRSILKIVLLVFVSIFSSRAL
jgi:hypothetical protein